jgi:hypothetical protein
MKKKPNGKFCSIKENEIKIRSVSCAMIRRPREDGWRFCTSEKHSSSSYLKSVQKTPHSRESTSEP